MMVDPVASWARLSAAALGNEPALTPMLPLGPGPAWDSCLGRTRPDLRQKTREEWKLVQSLKKRGSHRRSNPLNLKSRTMRSQRVLQRRHNVAFKIYIFRKVTLEMNRISDRRIWS